MSNRETIDGIKQQLDDLIGEHGVSDVWHALDMLCWDHARKFAERKPHVPAIWKGWANLFAGMAQQALMLADPWSNE